MSFQFNDRNINKFLKNLHKNDWYLDMKILLDFLIDEIKKSEDYKKTNNSNEIAVKNKAKDFIHTCILYYKKHVNDKVILKNIHVINFWDSNFNEMLTDLNSYRLEWNFNIRAEEIYTHWLVLKWDFTLQWYPKSINIEDSNVIWNITLFNTLLVWNIEYRNFYWNSICISEIKKDKEINNDINCIFNISY